MRYLFAAAMIALAASPGKAQDVAGWSDLFSPRQVLSAIVQYGVFAVRTQTNLTYGGLSLDPVENRTTIYDIVVTPVMGSSDFAACSIKIDRISIKGSPWGQTATIRIGIEVSGLKLTPPCSLQPPLSDLAAFQIDTVEVPRLSVDMRYDLPSGNASVLAYSVIDGLGTVTLDANFDYLAAGPGYGFSSDPVPVASLSSLKLHVENGGIWSKVTPLLSDQFTDPATGPARVVAILNSLRSIVIGPNPSPEVTERFGAFTKTVQSAAEQFLASPKELVIETGFDPSAPVLLDLPAYEIDPGELFSDLQPVVSVTPIAAKNIAPVNQLGAVLSNDSLTDDARIEVGIALLTGQGAPRNHELAIEVLSGLSAAGDAATTYQIAKALAETSPERAYSYALQASEGGAVGAAALLDEIEPRLDAQAMFDAQIGLDDLTPEVPGSIGAVRDLAAGYFDGRTGRSYVLASYWGRLAAAAGDTASLHLLDDIEDRVDALGAVSEWQKLDDLIGTRAVEDWVELDVAARLGAAK